MKPAVANGFVLGLTALAFATLAVAQGAAIDTDFEASPVGPATDCVGGLTGGGVPVDWQIVEDATAPAGPHVLAELSGDRTNNRFPVCLFPDFVAADVDVSVAFRPVAGTVDQAAGLVVRAIDANNYYIVRANALEGNVRFYKVEGGVRTQLAGVNTSIASGEWRTLGLRMRGDRAELLLDGAVLFEATDATFSAAGQVGLWTKADSLTHFDRFTASLLP